MNETIKMFLEENGYTYSKSGPTFHTFIKRTDKNWIRIEFDFESIYILVDASTKLTMDVNMDEHSIIMILCLCGATDLSVFKQYYKSLTA